MNFITVDVMSHGRMLLNLDLVTHIELSPDGHRAVVHIGQDRPLVLAHTSAEVEEMISLRAIASAVNSA